MRYDITTSRVNVIMVHVAHRNSFLFILDSPFPGRRGGGLENIESDISNTDRVYLLKHSHFVHLQDPFLHDLSESVDEC